MTHCGCRAPVHLFAGKETAATKGKQMDFKSRLTDEEFSEELAHAEETTNDILALLNSEVASRNERAKDVTGSRE